jgi:uncharacterized membrane protein
LFWKIKEMSRELRALNSDNFQRAEESAKKRSAEGAPSEENAKKAKEELEE